MFLKFNYPPEPNSFQLEPDMKNHLRKLAREGQSEVVRGIGFAAGLFVVEHMPNSVESRVADAFESMVGDDLADNSVYLQDFSGGYEHGVYLTRVGGEI